MYLIAYLVLILGFVNLVRIATFLIGSDLYDIRASQKQKPKTAISKYKTDLTYTNKKGFSLIRSGFLVNNTRMGKQLTAREYRPLVTVIVPAHNEEKTLNRNLDSVLNSSYKNVELIIVNDSSTDKTPQIAKNFQRKYRNHFVKVMVINVNVHGKARALNAGLECAKGSLFMCLDADSALTEKALEYGVSNFEDPKVVTLSSNVKIFTGKGGLNLFQRLEYLVCYQMKKTETFANTQYIVGGIGSMFRTQLVKDLGGYDVDTITEDIDLSMKIIGEFGKTAKVSYDPRMVVFTEAVIDFKGLLQQRFRWKYGRYQVFLKQRHLFWSRSNQQNPLLTWLYLPYALFGELTYVLEPLTYLLLLYLIFHFGDLSMLLGSLIVFLFYIVVQVTGASVGYSATERVKFILLSPFIYFGMFALSFVEYIATIRGLLNSKKLLTNYRNGGGDCNWQHVERAGTATIAG
ncbi:MAG TPA: glycosyltransferase family 2 protein [Candidatus Saccharimonadales bacterium]|nr:glycosyltransferase family 2 protein [Candidatus Saccharimonadales bacterium]